MTRMSTFEGRPLPHPDEPVFDQGLAFDVETLLSRRQVLRAIGYGAMGAGLVSIVGCAPGATSSPPGSSSPTAGSTFSAGIDDCAVEIPQETAGPFPGDGSNGPDILSESGVVRQDISSSFGASTTTAAARHALTGTDRSTVRPLETEPVIVPIWRSPPSLRKTMSVVRLDPSMFRTLCS